MSFDEVAEDLAPVQDVLALFTRDDEEKRQLAEKVNQNQQRNKILQAKLQAERAKQQQVMTVTILLLIAFGAYQFLD